MAPTCSCGQRMLASITGSQALLHDLHVQHAQEAAAEAEAQRLRGLGLVLEGGVVEPQPGQCLAQGLVVVRRHGKEAGEDARLHAPEAGQRRPRRTVGMRDGVAHRRAFHVLDARDHVADLARAQRLARPALGREDAHRLDLGDAPRGHDPHAVARRERALNHPHQADDAEVVVEPGVDDERLQGRVGVALRRGDAGHEGLEQLLHPLARLGAHAQGVMRLDADDLLDLARHALGLGRRQVDLVEDGQHLQALLDRRVAVGHALRLDALGGVDHEQRALAGGERARDLVAEVHVPRGVDEVELVAVPVARAIGERHRLGLDGDAALALELHGVEHLLLHLALAEPAADLDEAVGERGLAVVHVRDDGEVADALQVGCVAHGPVSAASRAARSRRWRQISRPPCTSTGTSVP